LYLKYQNIAFLSFVGNGGALFIKKSSDNILGGYGGFNLENRLLLWKNTI
jgi:hypothetical protein